MPETVYVVPEGRWTTGDVYGSSVTKDRVWFTHVSSSLGFLVKDTTTGFKDRREELEAAYPDGFDVVLVPPGVDLPPEIAHHYKSADSNTESGPERVETGLPSLTSSTEGASQPGPDVPNQDRDPASEPEASS